MTDDSTERGTETGARPTAGGTGPDGEAVDWHPTRRGVLRGTAAATAAVGFGSVAVGQDDGEEPLDPAETIVLGGRVEGWQGRDPASISGETNPTLNLQAGETYDLTWINVDGLPHNFVVLDPEGSVIQRSEIVAEQGAEQSVTIVVTEEMTTYLCEVHPTSMRGNVVVGEAAAGPAEPQIAEVPEGPEVGLQRVAGDPMTQPVSMATTVVDGAERLFVADQTGEVYLVTEGGVREFLDITERLVIRNEGFDERGLLGLAFHPAFEDNRRFYVRYSSFPREEELPEDYDHMFILSEFVANEAFTQADPDSERILMEIPEPQFNHNAGDIDFGPDGMLYVTVGDGGGADDTGIGHVNDWYEVNRGGNGQDVSENLLGSILRIDVDDREGGLPYGVPSDNPLVGREGLDEHWAWGFRNPWRFSFNGDQLVVADVGQNLWEEIDVVEKGENYGWNVREGAHCFSTENPDEPGAITDCPTSAPDEPPYDGQPLVDPVLEYPHTVDGQTVGLSVTGGHVYAGDALPALAGRYVFGDWSASFGRPAGRLFVADVPELAEPPEPEGVPAGNATVGNVTVEEPPENATVGNETDAGNATVGNETAEDGVSTGSETVGNETAGNETADAGTDGGQPADLPMRQLVVAGSPDGALNRTVLAFGRDRAGQLYVLTSTTTTVDGTGEVFRLVSPGEGDEIRPPEDQSGG